VFATVVGFIIAGRILAVVLFPLILTTWFMFVRPIQRRRLRDRVAALPEWKLTPE
jgi:multisubunit Na+/H+ antiporter MnhF subunit